MQFFEFFGTQGCHLCELAEQILVKLITDNITIQFIDIAEETQYFDNYSLRIPVLRNIQTSAELNWPFSLDEARRFLASNQD